MTIASARVRGHLSEAGSLLAALDAVTNWRAFMTLGVTLVAVAVVAMVLGSFSAFVATKSVIAGGLVGLVSFLVCFLIGLVGWTAAGILVSDEVWGRPTRSASSALVESAFTSHRIVVVLLAAAVVFGAYLVGLAVALFLCKIPGLGPLLYAVVLPVGATATGVLVAALLFVVVPLAAPGVWSGNSVMQVLAMLTEVVRAKLSYVIVLSLILSILVSAVVGIVWLVLGSGTSIMLSLSAVIVGVDHGGIGLMDLLTGLTGLGGGGAYAVALSFGFMVLLLLGIVPPLLVSMKGSALIYHGAVSDLSLDDAEADIRRRMDDIKQRAQDARQRAVAPDPPGPSAPAP